MADHQTKYEKYQNKNLGGFERLYPLSGEQQETQPGEDPDETLKDLYYRIKEFSQELFEN